MRKILNRIVGLKDKPEKVARGFALGSFIGMLPIPGLQLLVSLSVASLFKMNRKAACIAVFNTNIFTGTFVFAFNFWLGKTILGLHPEFTMPDRLGISFIKNILYAGTDVFFSMLTGGIITGAIASVITYFILRNILNRQS
jgi:uncharacterized protein (DUF2062 family)